MKLQALKERGRWLSAHAAIVESQCGEDGIIAKALTLLPSPNCYCVEFGAWDGRHLSNTYGLMRDDPRYRVVLIEPDAKKFGQLQRSYPFNDRATHIRAFVGFGEQDGLDAILANTPVPLDFDLLSIDIDGNDYHVWDATQIYKPRLVVIEYNPTTSNTLHFIQEKRADCQRGASPAALVELGRRKGYELVAVTGNNILFVRAEYFALFDIPDNSLELMRDDSQIPQLWIGYDGTILLSHAGHDRVSMLWHQTFLEGHRVQVLPSRLRKHPDNYTAVEKNLFRAMRRYLKLRYFFSRRG